MRERNIYILELQCADAVLARANVDRPDGFRSALGERGRGVEPSETMIEHALDVFRALKLVKHPGGRTALGLLSLTHRGEPIHTRDRIASELCIDRGTLRRWLNMGLDQFAAELQQIDQFKSSGCNSLTNCTVQCTA